jgi:hypothetical protein
MNLALMRKKEKTPARGLVSARIQHPVPGADCDHPAGGDLPGWISGRVSRAFGIRSAFRLPRHAILLTLWTSALMTIINAVMGLITAYVLVRYEFPGKRF